MKALAEYLPASAQPNGSETSKWSDGVTENLDLARHIYVQMAAIYPSTWRSQFTSPHHSKRVMVYWVATIRECGLSGHDIEHGLKQCRSTRQNFWPPSLPEFIALCRPPISYPAHARYRALPRPLADKDKALTQLRKAKQALSYPQT